MPYCDGLTCDTVVQLPWISTIIIVYYSTHVDRNIRFQPETPSKLLQPFSHYQRSLLIVLCPMWEFSKNRHRWHMMTLCLYFPAHNTTLILGHQSQTALGFSAFGSSLTSVIRLNAVYSGIHNGGPFLSKLVNIFFKHRVARQLCRLFSHPKNICSN